MIKSLKNIPLFVLFIMVFMFSPVTSYASSIPTLSASISRQTNPYINLTSVSKTYCSLVTYSGWDSYVGDTLYYEDFGYNGEDWGKYSYVISSGSSSFTPWYNQQTGWGGFVANNEPFTIENSSGTVIATGVFLMSGNLIPPSISYSNMSNNSLSIAWNTVPNATSYSIVLNGTTIATNVTALSYTVNGLKVGNNTITIIATNTSTGATSQSSINVSSPPAPPMNLSASTGTVSGEVQLSWNSSPGATSYNIYRNGVEVASGVKGTSYTDVGLNNGNTYTYYVTAFAASESSPSNIIKAIPSAPVLSAPTNVNITGSGSGTGTITWTPPQNAPSGVSYTIYQNGVPVATVTGTSYTIANYNPNATYTVSASAPGYTSSQVVSQYSSFSFGATPKDFVSTIFIIIESLAGFILLGICIFFIPRLIDLLRESNFLHTIFFDRILSSKRTNEFERNLGYERNLVSDVEYKPTETVDGEEISSIETSIYSHPISNITPYQE